MVTKAWLSLRAYMSAEAEQAVAMQTADYSNRCYVKHSLPMRLERYKACNIFASRFRLLGVK